MSILPADMMRHWYNDADYAADDRWRSFDPNRAALVLVDLINWQVDPNGGTLVAIRQAGGDTSYVTSQCRDVLIPTLQKVLTAARAADMTIVHAKLASRRDDYADIVPALRPYVQAAGAIEGSWSAAVLPELSVAANDITILKTGSGAFGGTELNAVLRRLKIDTIVYAGVVTNACVLLSVAAGFDLGYRQYVLRDCTAAMSAQDQAESERLIHLYMAEFVPAQDFLAALTK